MARSSPYIHKGKGNIPARESIVSIDTEARNSLASSQNWMWSRVAGTEIVRGGEEAARDKI